MTRKIILALACMVCGAAAQNVIQPEDSGTKVPPLQLRLYGGTRMIQGDDRPYVLGLNYSSGRTDVMSGDHFVKSRVGGGIGLASESRVSEPLHYGFELDLQFGSYLLIGLGAGLGYNYGIVADKVWLQGRAVLSYALISRDMGRIPGSYGLIVNGTSIYEPSVDVSIFSFIARPEINAFIKLADEILGMVGVGYQLPFLQSNISFDFSGEDIYGDTVTESIKSSSSSVILLLDGERVTKAKISPAGITISVAVALEI
jgi:hypothetical protein